MHPLTRRCCSRLGSGSLPTPRAVARQSASSGSLSKLYVASPTWLARNKHNAAAASEKADAPPSEKADAVVVGGGAAGMAIVGNLLESIPRGKVVWIDRAFKGGSISQLYREVPSYSPAGDFMAYARALETFRDICDAAPQPNAITALQALDPEMTCSLNHAADMLQLVSDGLLKHERVVSVVGTVTQAARNPRSKQWTLTLDPPTPGHTPLPTTYTTPLVVYCTGTRPRDPPLPVPISHLSADTALSPTRLAKILPPNEPRTVAVVGAGHAAVLALRNLFRLAAVSHRRLRIRWITRSEKLKYAQMRGEDGVVLNERDGLMGAAAGFARDMLEGEMLERGGAGGFIERVVLPGLGGGDGVMGEGQREVMEGLAVAERLEGVDYVVQAVGYERGRLPDVKPALGSGSGPVGRPKKLVFDGVRGSFYPSFGPRDRVVGLFGAGSAFPEFKETVEGVRKPAVGVWPFMQFAQKMVPLWVAAVRRGGSSSWATFGARASEAAVVRRKRHHEYY